MMARSRVLAGVAIFALLQGCTTGTHLAQPSATTAVAVGDEPNAVSAGRAILAQGGNAVDAATAMYFVLAVTYPVAAGLGGGGICLLHDPARGGDAEFDFLPRESIGGGAYAVPGNVRGFALLHGAGGSMSWERVVTPAEILASTGFAISGALATRLAAADNVVRLDAGLAAEFMDESAHTKNAGSLVSNHELAESLSAIRAQGPEAFYSGTVSTKLLAYSAAQGGAITAAELAAYTASQTVPQALAFGPQTIHPPGKHTGAGAFAGALFANLLTAMNSSKSQSTEASVVIATKQALADFGVRDLPNDLGATGFAVSDSGGRAVACAVTMNGPFGSGHTAEGTGVTLARAPATSTAGLAAAFLTPVMATDANGQIVLVGAGAGGPIGTASIADALGRLSKGEALKSKDAAAAAGTALYDTVNAILCRGGVCSALPDGGAGAMGPASPPSK